MASTASTLNINEELQNDSHRFDVVVIGAGQAGLAAGYYLKQHGLDFVILDERTRVGDIWRSRWDSLRMFTPAKYDALPGMKFPLPWHQYPTAQQMADYLEAYVERMGLPVRTGVKVDGLWPLNDSGDGFVVTAGDRRFEAAQVVVATGTQDRPRIPDFADQLDPRINQIHSSKYLRPSQLKDGGVLIIGGGNSGAEIALETSREHKVILSGSDPGQIPFRIDRWLRRVVTPILWFTANHVLTLKTPPGRKVGPFVRSGHGGPVVRVKRSDLNAAGVERIYGKTVRSAERPATARRRQGHRHAECHLVHRFPQRFRLDPPPSRSDRRVSGSGSRCRSISPRPLFHRAAVLVFVQFHAHRWCRARRRAYCQAHCFRCDGAAAIAQQPGGMSEPGQFGFVERVVRSRIRSGPEYEADYGQAGTSDRGRHAELAKHSLV